MSLESVCGLGPKLQVRKQHEKSEKYGKLVYWEQRALFSLILLTQITEASDGLLVVSYYTSSASWNTPILRLFLNIFWLHLPVYPLRNLLDGESHLLKVVCKQKGETVTESHRITCFNFKAFEKKSLVAGQPSVANVANLFH